MTSSISNSITDFLISRNFENDINLLIYSQEIVTFKGVLDIIHTKNFSKALKKEDILLDNYFVKHLPLHQNIKFHSNINQINTCNFLSEFNLEKDYEELKYKFFKNCDRKKWNKFEALFFLNAHHNLLIAKENFFNSLDFEENKISSLIKNKQIFFLTHRKAGLGKIINFFDLFIYINENDYMMYSDNKDFMKKILQLS